METKKEETHNTEVEELDQLILAHIAIQSGFHAGNNTIDDVNAAGEKIKAFHRQQLQKALEVQAIQIREEEANEYNKIIEREVQKARKEENERCFNLVAKNLEEHDCNIDATTLFHSELDQDLVPIEIPVKGTQIDCKEHGAMQIVIKDGAGWCGECLKTSELDQGLVNKIV